MVDFNVNVRVNTKPAKSKIDQIDKRLKKVEKTSESVGKKLKQAFAGVSIFLAVRSLQRFADTFTNIQNRLKVVTTTTKELNTATAELFAIANRTRSSFEATAEIYSRVGLATKNLGIDQKQTLQFTESLNQAVILSGASAQEAQAGLIQLGQGLASGALRGDELRSVLEQLPVVADVIAKSMNITRGELRILGSEGKISAKIVLDAFAEAREELAERFAKSVPTIAQAFTILSNNVILFVGQLDEATGASRLVVQAIVSVALNLQNIGLALIVVAAGFAALKLPALIVGFQTLAATTTIFSTALAFLAANPLVLFVVGLTAIVILIFKFQTKILEAVNSIPFLSTALTVLANVFKFLLAGGIAVVLGAFEAMKFSLEGLVFIFEMLVQSGKNALSPLVNFFKNLGSLVSFIVKKLEEFLGQFEFLRKIVKEVTKVLTEFFKKLTIAFNKVIDIADRFLGRVREIKEEIEETATSSAAAAGGIVKDMKKSKDAAERTGRGIRDAFAGLKGAISEPIVNGVGISIAEFNKLGEVASKVSSQIRSSSFSPSGSGGGPAFGEGTAGTGATFFSELGKRFSQTGKIAQLGGGGGGSLRGGGGSFGGSGTRDPNLDPLDDPTRGIFNKAGGLRGFQQGGSFRVGGSGGPDSQDVRFKATPDETVTVTKPGQDGGKRPIIINFDIRTENADSFKLSQKQIISTMATEIQRVTEGE